MEFDASSEEESDEKVGIQEAVSIHRDGKYDDDAGPEENAAEEGLQDDGSEAEALQRTASPIPFREYHLPYNRIAHYGCSPQAASRQIPARRIHLVGGFGRGSSPNP